MDDELVRRREINDVMRHDLRTRVGIGNGYLAMLVAHHDALTADQRAAALRGLAEAFARLDAFGRRVLMDEKLLTREVRAEPGEVTVAALLGPARVAYPDVVVDVADGVPETVFVDPLLVREVLDNLLANARAAAPPDTEVTLRVRGGGPLRFEVRDEGPGVTEADRAVLFRRYGRTERSRRLGESGMGLGLSVVARLVEAHGGSYGLDTAGGTTFWFELPAVAEGTR
ncbi:MAG TPA: sensor histidine kinase [Frankiaceae bacterium]|nr:sensor histidine kinase [Frankiaceae bacterium]